MTLRESIAWVLQRARLTEPEARHRDKLVVVTFHRVLPAELRELYPFPGLVVTPDELASLLAYFTEHYRCGSLLGMHEELSRGGYKQPLLAVTFDDGQLDNYEYALPILTHAGVRATFFVPAAPIDAQAPIWHDRLGFAVQKILETDHGPRHLEALLHTHEVSAADACDPGAIADAAKGLPEDGRAELVGALEAHGGRVPAWAGLMSWEQVKKLHDAGHEIGSHSMTHALLPECAPDRLERELVQSKRVIEENIHDAVESFCYPNGDHDEEVLRLTEQAGYRRAVTTQAGANDRSTNPYALRRFDMDTRRVIDSRGQVSPALLSFRLSGLNPRA